MIKCDLIHIEQLRFCFHNHFPVGSCSPQLIVIFGQDLKHFHSQTDLVLWLLPLAFVFLCQLLVAAVEVAVRLVFVAVHLVVFVVVHLVVFVAVHLVVLLFVVAFSILLVLCENQQPCFVVIFWIFSTALFFHSFQC